MYFRNRKDAGKKLSKELNKYGSEEVSILAFGVGGYLVAKQISNDLNCSVSVIHSEEITAPGDPSTIIAEVDQSGDLTYNSNMSSGQLEEVISEFHNYIDQERIRLLHKLNLDSGFEPKLDLSYLRNRNIIVVTDGAKDSVVFDVALAFLRKVSVKKVIAAVPVASINAIDRMHVLFDELHCLNVTPNFISVEHYYEEPEDLDVETSKMPMLKRG